MLLDEADGNLDPNAAKIVERIVTNSSGTVILVTHKLERLADADIVWHLESGRLIEIGTTDEVLARDGPTARLFRLPVASQASL
ncbi:MAG: hypothetical protein ACREV2_18055 [Burkholderiales bacterium]